MATFFGFVAWLVLCLAVGGGILYLIARYRGEPPEQYLISVEHDAENNWALVLMLATAITFVIACFNSGPAILLPKNYPTLEQRGVVSNVLNHLLYGKDASKATVPTEPLPWATGTWFWWKAWFFLVILTTIFSLFAFWDDIREAYQRRRQWLKEEVERRRREPNSPPQPRPQRDGGHGFGARLVVEFLAEIVAEIVTHFVTRRRGA